VINAYAAAVVGRLRSLPLTAVGAVILGLARERRRYRRHRLLDGTRPSWINRVDRAAPHPRRLINVETVPFVVFCCWCPRRRPSLFGTASPIAAGMPEALAALGATSPPWCWSPWRS
jgi:hypothetical protein